MSYPEHEKLAKIKDESQVIGEFLDWCADEKGILLSRKIKGRELSREIVSSIPDLLAEFFAIDLEKIEEEKRQMIAKLRGEE